jgi:hypothetical protein
MVNEFKRRRVAASLLGLSAILLAGCVSPPGTYPDPSGPRNGDGFLVDPRTGVTLPGQPEAGGAAR